MDHFYRPKLVQPENVIYNGYNNISLPYKYVIKPLKGSIFSISSGEEKQNPNGFNNLTEKTMIISTHNKISGTSTANTSFSLSNSKKHIKQLNYYNVPVSHNRIMLPHKKCSMQNRINNSSYISLNTNNTESHQNEMEKIYKNNNINQDIKKNNNVLRQKNNIIKIRSYYQNNNSNSNNESSYYKVKNNDDYVYNNTNNNKFLSKNYSYILKKDYYTSNIQTSFNSNTENNTKNKYKEKWPFDLASNTFKLNQNQKKYDYTKYKTNYQDENKEYFDDYMKYNTGENKYYRYCNYAPNKNQTINTIYKNSANSIKSLKYNKSSINTCLNRINRKENYTYIESLNKSQNNSFLDNYEDNNNNRIVKKLLPNKNKNKVINVVENNRTKDNISSMNKNGKILSKNTSLTQINLNTSNDYNDNKTNHSFYESKSLTKNSSNKNSNTKINNQNNNNNNVIDKKKQKNVKENKIRIIKIDTNNKMLEDKSKKEINNTNIKTKIINLMKKKDGKINKVQKVIYRNTSYKNSNNTILSNKENINTNNINYNISKNSYILQQIDNNNNKKDKTIVLNTDIITNNEKSKNLKTFKKIIFLDGELIKNKNSKNKDKEIDKNKAKENSYINMELNQKIKMSNSRPISDHPECDEKQISNKDNIMCYHYFSFLSSPNNTKKLKLKKSKKRFNSHKNIIQLKNINNKAYEEDFILKEKKESKMKLKPTISTRIAIFGKKESEDEKYFIVNLFCSENVRNQPEEIESDF